MRHALGVGVSEACKPEQRLDRVDEALARCDLYPHPGVSVARVPPVVPHSRLDNARLTLVEDARLPVPLDGQFPPKGSEALDERGVAVLAKNAGADEGGELSDPGGAQGSSRGARGS